MKQSETKQKQFGITLSFTIQTTEESAEAALNQFHYDVMQLAKKNYPTFTHTVATFNEYLPEQTK